VLGKLVRLENRLEIALADLLVELHEERAWPGLGYGGLEEYAEDRLGLGRSTVRGRVSLARQLRRFPIVRAAYASGRIGLEKTQTLVRMVRERLEARHGQWIDHAELSSVKRVRHEDRILEAELLRARAALARSLGRGNGMAARNGGAGPEAPGLTAGFSPGLPQVPGAAAGATADTAATAGTDDPRSTAPFSPALRQVPVDDATWRESLRRVPGQTRQEVASLGFDLVARFDHAPLLPVVVRLSLAPELAAALRGCIEAARRELAAQPPPSPAEACRLRPSQRLARACVERKQRLPEWVAYLAVLESCAGEWDAPERCPKRDPVLERDGWLCMAPGCTARADLQRHHLIYRSEGGGDEASNRILLCSVHHRLGEHGGLARCRGRAPLDVVWRLGAQGLDTWWQNEMRLPGPP
jgi:hypothetical protein